MICITCGKFLTFMVDCWEGRIFASLIRLCLTWWQNCWFLRPWTPLFIREAIWLSPECAMDIMVCESRVLVKMVHVINTTSYGGNYSFFFLEIHFLSFGRCLPWQHLFQSRLCVYNVFKVGHIFVECQINRVSFQSKWWKNRQWQVTATIFICISVFFYLARQAVWMATLVDPCFSFFMIFIIMRKLYLSIFFCIVSFEIAV